MKIIRPHAELDYADSDVAQALAEIGDCGVGLPAAKRRANDKKRRQQELLDQLLTVEGVSKAESYPPRSFRI